MQNIQDVNNINKIRDLTKWHVNFFNTVLNKLFHKMLTHSPEGKIITQFTQINHFKSLHTLDK